MSKPNDCKRFTPATVLSLLACLAVAGFLTSCATTGTTNASNVGFKFWVLRYKPPVDATTWVADTALSADPEGAALNIASAMKQGNLEEWLANWDSLDRPQPSKEEAAALLRKWKILQGSQVSILGRVVAEADIIVELAVTGEQNQTEKIQIPLKRSKDRWWITAMNPTSEYLNWEGSQNKIIDYVDPNAFQKHLEMIQGAKAKAKTAEAPKSKPLAGL